MKRILLIVAGACLLIGSAPDPGLAGVQQPQTPVVQDSQEQAKTFTGTVVKKGDNFMLEDKERKVSYQLDDAQKASRFEGRKVKVTGTLDTAKNLIRVQTIEEVA